MTLQFLDTKRAKLKTSVCFCPALMCSFLILSGNYLFALISNWFLLQFRTGFMACSRSFKRVLCFSHVIILMSKVAINI